MPRRWLGLLIWGCSCSSDDETIKETYDFTDSEARACQATLEKTSPGSRSIGSSVHCESAGKACSSKSSPCFVLNVDSETNAIRNCPACCKGNSFSFFGSECAIVACEAAADCVYAKASCDGGLCHCPGGNCE